MPSDDYRVLTRFTQQMRAELRHAVEVKRETPEISVIWEMPRGGNDTCKVIVQSVEVEGCRYWTLKGTVLGVKPGSSDVVHIRIDVFTAVSTITWG